MRVRIPWRAAVVLLVLGGIVTGTLIGFGVFEREINLRPEVRALLTKLVPGGDESKVRRQAKTIYEESSFLLRQAVLRDKFLDMADRLNRTLGAFEHIVDVTELERNESIAGDTARVVLELQFAHGQTEGEVSFIRHEDEKWRLLGVYIVIPKDLRHEAHGLEAQYERIKAPPEVIEKVSEILERIRDGEGADVYREASPQLKESVESAERFEALLDKQEQALGHFKRILAVISSGQNADKTRARVYALLEYDKQKTTGTFELIKAPSDAARGGSWTLAYYRIIIPQPLLPTRD